MPLKRTKKKTNKTIFIYLIQDGIGHIKIGLAKRPNSRLKALQTANATELHLLATTQGSQKYERYLHGRYSHRRMCGEWFRLNPAELREIIMEFKQRNVRRGAAIHQRLEESRNPEESES